MRGRSGHDSRNRIAEIGALLRTDPHAAAELAARLCARPERGADDDPADYARLLYLWGQALYQLGDYDEATSRYEMAFRALVDHARAYERLAAQILGGLGLARYRLGDLAGALGFLRSGLDYAAPGEDEWIRLMGNSALVYREIGSYEQALAVLLEMLTICGDNAEAPLYSIFDSIATVYAVLGDYDNCFDYQQRALRTARERSNRAGEAMALGNLGASHNDVGRYDEALSYLQEALRLNRELEDVEGEARALHNIGVSYDRLGKFSLALRYFRTSIGTLKNRARTDSLPNSLASMGSILRKQGKPAEAARMLTRALKIADENLDLELQCRIHEELADAHEATGSLHDALTHHRRFTELREIANNDRTRRAVAELQIRFDVERAGNEREIYRLKSERLEQDLLLKNAELTTMALRLMERGEALASMKDEISEALTKPPAAVGTVLKTVLRRVDADGDPGEDSDSFLRQFMQVHPTYLKTLSEAYPKLSPSELKICALLKVNLSSKEIARLLHVSIRDIENHRYRLRRKLGLERSVNLTSFLAGI